MVANPAEVTTFDEHPGAAALELVTLMETAAANGEWSRTEKLASQLRLAVLEIPEAVRRDTVVAVARVMERIQTIALTSRVETLEKLSEIRRGRVAQRAYGQPEISGTGASLR